MDQQIERRNFRRIQCLRDVQGTSSPQAAQSPAFDATGLDPLYLHGTITQTTPATLATWPQFQAWAQAAHPPWIAIAPADPMPYPITPAAWDSFLRNTLHYQTAPCRQSAAIAVYVPSATSGR